MQTTRDRVTRADVDKAVQRLADKLGVPVGHYTTHDNEPDLSHLDGDTAISGESPTPYKVQGRDGRWHTTRPNGLDYDHNRTYGGYVLEQIAPNGRTWVSRPYGETRRNARDFIAFIDGLISRMGT